MFKLKKAISLICSFAIVTSMMVISAGNAFAELGSISYGMETGVTAGKVTTTGLGTNKKTTCTTNVVLTMDQLFTSEEEYRSVKSFVLSYKVDKNVFSGVSMVKLEDGGMTALVDGSDLNCTALLNTSKDDFDIISLVFYSLSNLWTTMDGKVAELKLTYNSNITSNFPEVVFTPYIENGNVVVTNADGSKEIEYFGTLNDDNRKQYENIQKDFAPVEYEYVLSGSTESKPSNVITKRAISTTTTYSITKADTTNGSFVVDKTTAAENETVKVTPSADEGFEVDTVKFNNTDATDNGDGTYSFAMPAQNVTVAVTFKAIQSPDTGFKAEAVESTGAEASDKDKAYAFVQKLDNITAGTSYWLYAVTENGRFKYNKKQISLPNMTEGAIALGVVIQYDSTATNLFNPADVTGFELSVN